MFNNSLYLNKDLHRQANATELSELEKKQTEIVTSEGDVEVRVLQLFVCVPFVNNSQLLDFYLKQGRYFARIGEWAQANKSYDAILNKAKVTSGRKIDAHFEKAKIALFNSVSASTWSRINLCACRTSTA